MSDNFSQKHHPSEIRLIRETMTLEIDPSGEWFGNFIKANPEP